MINKDIYSVQSFLKILEKNSIDCKFDRCILFPDYVVYSFMLNGEDNLTEFQLYSVTFSVIVESENSCYFLGKNGKQILFLLTMTNDLKKFGLKKTKDKLGIVPRETYEFEFMKKDLENIVWYKFDMKSLGKENKKIRDFLEGATGEERAELEEKWQDIIE